MGVRAISLLVTGSLALGAVLLSASHQHQAVRAAGSGEAKSSAKPTGRMPSDFDREVARVEAEVDRIEADTLSHVESTTLDRQGQMRTLGRLLIFDKHFSV